MFCVECGQIVDDDTAYKGPYSNGYAFCSVMCYHFFATARNE